MGNCFGRPKSDNFNGEGRTIGSAAPAPASRPVKSPLKGPGRTVGGGNSAAAPPRADTGQGPGPGAAAAKAAEERLKAAQGKGKLGRQLDAQKSLTQADTLKQVSAENRVARDADAGQAARAYN